MALLAATDIRARIPGLEASDDTRLGLLISEAESALASWLWAGETSLESHAVVDTLDGPDTAYPDKLWLSQRPVLSGSVSVTEDGDTVSTSDYSVDEEAGALYREDDGAWVKSRRYTVASYNAGWTSGAQPDEVTSAVVLTVERLWRLGHVQGLPNASDEDGPEDRTMPPREALQLVAAYKSWGQQ